MHHYTKAVIFDMDGVIIDSEPLWRIAMVQAFNDTGIPFTEDDCRKTTGMRLNEVIKYWQKLYPDNIKSVAQLDHSIINNLINLIHQKGTAINGLKQLLDHLKNERLKIGLATSSSKILIETVINKLEIADYFDAIVSAQDLKYGKPHPEVYLLCAEQLNIHPFDCLVIEDSINGVISAKAAQMKVLAMPDQEHINNVKFKVADGIIDNLTEAIDFIILN